MKNQIRRIQLPSEFIPNSHEHLMKWDKMGEKGVFKSDVSDEIVRKIMLLEIEPIWKILL